jgi:hypothetical protein
MPMSHPANHPNKNIFVTDRFRCRLKMSMSYPAIKQILIKNYLCGLSLPVYDGDPTKHHCFWFMPMSHPAKHPKINYIFDTLNTYPAYDNEPSSKYKNANVATFIEIFDFNKCICDEPLSIHANESSSNKANIF